MTYLLISLPDTQDKLIIAEQLAPSVLSKISLSLETLQTIPILGTDLLNCTYLNPLTPTESPMPILPAGYVTSDSGTGLVHSAPGHGAEDYSLFRDRNVIPFSPVDGEGKYTNAVHPVSLRGLSVLKEGNEAVVKLLNESGELLHQHMYTHKYPYDWRSKEPVIVRATEQWFASVENIKHDAITAISGVKMIPRTGTTHPHCARI
jgi:isoleucyl-tRNA synthetase